MYILITGANLINKGAQSMLYTTVDQLKRIMPECKLLYGTYRGDSTEKYCFDRLYYDPYIKHALLKKSFSGLKRFKQELINRFKFVSRRTQCFNSIKDSIVKIKKINMIIDISGYALGDKWSFDYNESYLDNIRVAKELNIPICLMPQSFGPFYYDDKMEVDKARKLKQDIQDLMEYPVLVFAREKESESYLRELGVKNVSLSKDLVLQSPKMEYKNVFNQIQIYSMEMKENKQIKKVAIIPNVQIIVRGYKEKLFAEYDLAIKELSSLGYEVLLISHSGEDDVLCKELGERYRDIANVKMGKMNLTCYEYSEYIRQFDFIISSRFHAAVHALKENVPVIAVGWAPKYKELMESVCQEQFSYNICEDEDEKRLQELVCCMHQNKDNAKMVINKKIISIQKTNCFEVLKGVIYK